MKFRMFIFSNYKVLFDRFVAYVKPFCEQAPIYLSTTNHKVFAGCAGKKGIVYFISFAISVAITYVLESGIVMDGIMFKYEYSTFIRLYIVLALLFVFVMSYSFNKPRLLERSLGMLSSLVVGFYLTVLGGVIAILSSCTVYSTVIYNYRGLLIKRVNISPEQILNYLYDLHLRHADRIGDYRSQFNDISQNSKSFEDALFQYNALFSKPANETTPSVPVSWTDFFWNKAFTYGSNLVSFDSTTWLYTLGALAGTALVIGGVYYLSTNIFDFSSLGRNVPTTSTSEVVASVRSVDGLYASSISTFGCLSDIRKRLRAVEHDQEVFKQIMKQMYLALRKNIDLGNQAIIAAASAASTKDRTQQKEALFGFVMYARQHILPAIREYCVTLSQFFGL